MITNIFAVSVQHFFIIQAMKTKATLKTRLMLYGSIGASIEVWWAVTVARVVGCGSYKWHIFMWHIWNSCFSCALAQVPGECFIPLKKCPDPQQQETFLTKIQNHISKNVGRKTYYLIDFLNSWTVVIFTIQIFQNSWIVVEFTVQIVRTVTIAKYE